APVDAGGLENADDDGEAALALDFFEHYHLLVVDFADDDALQLHVLWHGRLAFAVESPLIINGRGAEGQVSRGEGGAWRVVGGRSVVARSPRCGPVSRPGHVPDRRSPPTHAHLIQGSPSLLTVETFGPAEWRSREATPERCNE